MIKLKKLIESPDCIEIQRNRLDYNSQLPDYECYAFQYKNNEIKGYWSKFSHRHLNLYPTGRLFCYKKYNILSLWQSIRDYNKIITIAQKIKQKNSFLPDINNWYIDLDAGIKTGYQLYEQIIHSMKLPTEFSVIEWFINNPNNNEFLNFCKKNNYYFGYDEQVIVPLIDYPKHCKKIIEYIYQDYKQKNG